MLEGILKVTDKGMLRRMCEGRRRSEKNKEKVA